MVDSPTATINLLKPSHGGDVGAWDTPVNSNMDIIDSLTGVVATIGLNNSNVILSAGQFQSGMIIFNSTLTGNVAITFPTTYAKAYEIQNLCSGSSSFTITLTTGSGQVVACPPGEVFEVRNDGANIKYKNFGRIGDYRFYCGSSVPAWVTACTVPPYLYCDGSAFSSAVYPALATIMQGTTLPDTRGRIYANLNDGTNRIGPNTDVDGNTLYASGGNDDYQQHFHGVTDPGHFHTDNQPVLKGYNGVNHDATGPGTAASFGTIATLNQVTNISIQNAGGGGSGNVPPAYIGGITMVRSA